jgi:predicted transcriptional regulator
MKKRTLNELRQEKEFGYKAPLTNIEINELSITQQIKTQLENSNINVVITPVMYDPESVYTSC